MAQYAIIHHGVEYPDSFQGCGVSGTDYTDVVTGIGENAKEAYRDAVEQIYNVLSHEQAEALRLPTRPHGVRQRDRVPVALDEAYYYLSIRYRA